MLPGGGCAGFVFACGLSLDLCVLGLRGCPCRCWIISRSHLARSQQCCFHGLHLVLDLGSGSIAQLFVRESVLRGLLHLKVVIVLHRNRMGPQSAVEVDRLLAGKTSVHPHRYSKHSAKRRHRTRQAPSHLKHFLRCSELDTLGIDKFLESLRIEPVRCAHHRQVERRVFHGQVRAPDSEQDGLRS